MLPENMENASIAIVMTDIIGSTKFVQKHGASVAAQWFSIHDKITMSLIYEYGGQFIDASDGMLCYFASVGDAIAFGFAYKKKLRQKKFPFRSRLGIHWADMIITKTNQKLVKGGAKRMNIEGIGKNVCARIMSICGPEQILLSYSAHLQFKKRLSHHPHIPKKTMIVLVGLYQFKGVSNPEQVYAVGLTEAQLQPPPDGEKVKRLGGAKKIKMRLKYKSLKEKVEYIFWRIGFAATLVWIYFLWPLLVDPYAKASWGIDYWFLVPFEWINACWEPLRDFAIWFWENFKKYNL